MEKQAYAVIVLRVVWGFKSHYAGETKGGKPGCRLHK